MRGIGCRIYLAIFAVLFAAIGIIPLGAKKSTAIGATMGAKVHYLDVGQGDATFIELPDGKTMLIDGGEEGYGKSVSEYIQDLGYNSIDYMIATHSDSDHIGGLITVLKNLEVKEIFRPFTISMGANGGFVDELAEKFFLDITNYPTETSPEYAEFLSLAYSEEVGNTLAKIQVATDKSIITSNSPENPYMVKFFMPKAVSPFVSGRIDLGYTVEKQEDNNDTSAVIELVTQTSKFLFMGDLTTAGETQMIANLSGLDKTMLSNVSVLKVGHHGAKTSSSAELLALVQPAYAIISVGEDNEYGHPHSETLSSLESSGAIVYKTSELGTIIAEEQGAVIIISNIETKSFFEKHTWVIYLIIGVVAAGLMVVIAVFSIKNNRKKAAAAEILTKPVDKNSIR